MKFEKTEVFNFEGSLRGMRNPKNSHHLSDSYFGLTNLVYSQWDYEITSRWMKRMYPGWPEVDVEDKNSLFEDYYDWITSNGILKLGEHDGGDESRIGLVAYIGPNDMKLAQQLIKAGGEHRKFLRQIFVSVDITAPIYWWKEADTYKVSTTANSTSTMHKLHSTPITLDCFETGDYDSNLVIYEDDEDDEYGFGRVGAKANEIMIICEELRQKYIQTGDKRYWKELIRWLPSSWLQTRTWTSNYETIRNMYHQRKNHKLTEWRDDFCSWVETLPYAAEFLTDEDIISFD